MSGILLTGATGFVGRQTLAQLVASGENVHAVARTVGESRIGVSWHAADLLRFGTATALIERIRPDQLIHLAWTATPGQFWSSPENVAWAAATLELHDAFVKAGGVRAVYAGTCAEYDWSEPELDEWCTPLAPKTLYGAAKATTGTLLLAAQEQGGPSIVWGRIFYLYGPGEAPGRLVSDVVSGILAGRHVDCTECQQQRDFMHVTDVARAFVALLRSDIVGAVNIASGQSWPIRDFLEEIGQQTGRPELLRFGARPALENDPPRLATQAARLRNEVGFAPRFDFLSGIADTIAWWRARSPSVWGRP
jgi:nucleoside-diphosphate-sugar epimerase